MGREESDHSDLADVGVNPARHLLCSPRSKEDRRDKDIYDEDSRNSEAPSAAIKSREAGCGCKE